jgi:hypothetical protein
MSVEVPTLLIPSTAMPVDAENVLGVAAAAARRASMEAAVGASAATILEVTTMLPEVTVVVMSAVVTP